MMQVRSQELESQFAATTAELEELSRKHKALESRNLLLERLVQLNKEQQQQQPQQLVPDMDCQDNVRLAYIARVTCQPAEMFDLLLMSAMMPDHMVISLLFLT